MGLCASPRACEGLNPLPTAKSFLKSNDMLSSLRANLQSFARRNFSFISTSVRDEEDSSGRPRDVIYSIMERIFGSYVPLALYALIMTSLITGAIITTSLHGPISAKDIASPATPTAVPAPTAGERTEPPALEIILLIIFCVSIFSVAFLIIANRVLRGVPTTLPIRMTSAALNAPVTTSNSARLTQMLARLVQMGRASEATALRSRLRMAMMNRDFNGNDYEMLQSLDDQNPHVGATEGEISRLPVHTMTQANIDQSINLEDSSKSSCSICLAPYDVGDSIKTVMCLVSSKCRCTNCVESCNQIISLYRVHNTFDEIEELSLIFFLLHLLDSKEHNISHKSEVISYGFFFSFSYAASIPL